MSRLAGVCTELLLQSVAASCTDATLWHAATPYGLVLPQPGVVDEPSTVHLQHSTVAGGTLWDMPRHGCTWPAAATPCCYHPDVS